MKSQKRPGFTQTTVVVPTKIFETLKNLSRQTGMSMSRLIQNGLQHEVARQRAMLDLGEKINNLTVGQP